MIEDIVKSIYKILDFKHKEAEKLFKNKELSFCYRKSNIVGFIVEINLKLNQKSKKNVFFEMNKIIKKRKHTQPLNQPNIGCFFKNPTGNSAGKIIDSLGLKELKIGDAVVSNKHANFIINQGNAKSSDIIYLTELIKEKVINQLKIKLELEIKIV